MTVDVPLSVLDLSTVRSDETTTDAVAHTIELARAADRLGYERFWLAEHHGMPGVASSAPAVLIAGVAAATERIRVGSGGVMLPNHSSLVIAEQFGTLVSLYGDRIDLGLGRAPGTDQFTASVLRRGSVDETAQDFPNQVLELFAWFGMAPPLDNGIGSRIVATPGAGAAPEIWLLGSSGFSAQLAGILGVRFAFAHHFAGGDQTPAAFELYRERFEPSAWLDAPHSGVAVAVALGETDEEARRRTLPQQLSMIRLRSGAPGRTPTAEEADAHPWTDAELAFVASRNASQAVGTLSAVEGRIRSLVGETGADEVIVVPQGADTAQKVSTLEALAR
ncbi:LLM class flavin-dependent oxidoreductase [Galbitalea sp. SE-J8]|uniref:LLM class flavin-dependent oxidoreductase n=1 Tax=Galbitalea sp. SE-J8 TaxID=3054952 RepID=UPI00259CCEF1|nr:LLM class flavin-dependent oxidoreductase [Galbitalea sp. SE-J8]MDM4764104.1 LLM class flavin-dependent oxidoreductase [Galbitalea sp. SE-J8]